MERTLALLAVAAFASPVTAQVALQDTEHSSATAGAAARFGSAVAADGSFAIVGAPEASVGSPAAGLAEIFERDANGNWTSQAVLFGTSVQSLARFGTTVAIDGDSAAASYATIESAELFERDTNGVWGHLQTIASPDPTFHDFGNSVALDGDRLVVAASASGAFVNGPGAISVFERTGGMFTFDQSVAMPAALSTTALGSFGASMDIDGDVVVVGDARYTPPGFPNNGRVFVFERQPGGNWLATQTLTTEFTTAGAFFGSSVALDGDRLVVGAPGEQANAGRVRIFERTAGGPFALQATISGFLLNPTAFGQSVALNGDRLAVGEPLADATGSNAGLVRLYDRTSAGQWVQSVALGHTTPMLNDFLGDGAAPIALLDDELLVGQRTRGGFTGALHSYSLGGLFHGTPLISLAAGGSQSLFVRAGAARAGDVFVILGSFSGTTPGIPLAPGVELPLVFDAYTNLGLSFATSVAPDFGALDAAGRVDAAFVVPAGASSSFAGAVIHHAVLTIDTTTFEVDATNAVRVELML